MIKWLRRMWLTHWVYRNVDENVCCCGSELGSGGSICAHAGCCVSAKVYSIEAHLNNMGPIFFKVKK